MGSLLEQPIGGAQPVGPRAVRTRDHDGFVEAVGERIALLGADEGRIEVWMWPLLLVHDLRVRAGPPGGVAEALGERTITAVPEGIGITWRVDGATISMTAVAMQRSAGLVLLFEVALAEETLGGGSLDLALTFTPALRPLWPAGLGGQIFRRDDDTGAVLLTEETGQFAALIGSPDADEVHVVGGRGLPAPIELRVRVDRDRDAHDPIVVAIAGARATEAPVDEARALLRHLWSNWADVVAAERTRWRQYLDDTPSLHTGDKSLDAAFEWSKIALERAWVDVEGVGRVIVAGYGTDLGGARPSGLSFSARSALEACRAFAALGRRESCNTILRSIAETQRDDGKLASEVALSAGLCDWFGAYEHAYRGTGQTRAFLDTLADALAWSGDGALGDELAAVAERARTWCAASGAASDSPCARLTDAEVLALNGPKTMSDWGQRAATNDREVANGLGSVTPPGTLPTVLALYARGHDDAGWQVLRSLAQWLGLAGPGVMPEVLAGDRARLLPLGAPHCTASHATLIRLVTGALFGLEPGTQDATPRVPLELESMALRGVHARGERFDVSATRDPATAPRASFPWQVDIFAPSVSARLVAVRQDEDGCAWTIEGPFATIVRIPFEAPPGTRVEGAQVEGRNLVIAFPTPTAASPASSVGFGKTVVRFLHGSSD